ncbi:MAG: S24 family peptidase [Oscillospiraceae bacterium]|nr:S24 family peptidase [Oscillospiraceae bacterium]
MKKLGNAELISLNPGYVPRPITEFDSFRTFGKVAG